MIYNEKKFNKITLREKCVNCWELINNTFELIEEDEKIDIDSIEEIDLFDNGQGFENIKVVKEAYDSNFGHITDTINSLIKAVKQLNKKMKEKE